MPTVAIPSQSILDRAAFVPGMVRRASTITTSANGTLM